MNIGIIVYSLSGHTLSVATKLKEELAVAGHEVTLERVETAGPATLSCENSPLKSKPAVESYDALVLASPVRGGQLPPPMASYLKQMPSLAGKNVACLVTGFFPAAQWGRNQTLAQMADLCGAKGATVSGTGSVGWFSLTRKRQISEAVDSLSELF